MAEAVAKHFKEFLPNAPTIAEVTAPTPVPAPPAAPPTAPAPAPVAYQQQGHAPVEPVTQTTQVISRDESLADAAQRARQHKACLELAKNNPSITCN
jgi:hypothetical protein